MTLEWHNRKVVILSSGDYQLESTAMIIWPGVQESRIGHAIRVGVMALLSLFNQEDSSQSWQAMSSCMQKGCDVARVIGESYLVCAIL